MDHKAVDKLLNLLEDVHGGLEKDDIAALLYSVDEQYLYYKNARDRLIHHIGRDMDEDGVLEEVTDKWVIERTTIGAQRYEYNTPYLEKNLKPLLRPDDWEMLFKVIPEKKEVKRSIANDLSKKRGSKVREVLDNACIPIPRSRSVQVKPITEGTIEDLPRSDV